MCSLNYTVCQHILYERFGLTFGQKTNIFSRVWEVIFDPFCSKADCFFCTNVVHVTAFPDKLVRIFDTLLLRILKNFLTFLFLFPRNCVSINYRIFCCTSMIYSFRIQGLLFRHTHTHTINEVTPKKNKMNLLHTCCSIPKQDSLVHLISKKLHCWNIIFLKELNFCLHTLK